MKSKFLLVAAVLVGAIAAGCDEPTDEFNPPTDDGVYQGREEPAPECHLIESHREMCKGVQ